MRPAQPRSVVLLPFGGHSKAEGAGCFGSRRCAHWKREFNTEIGEVTEITKIKKPKPSLNERSFSVQPAVQDWRVSIDAAVAKEGPVAAGVFAFGGITFDNKDFFFVVCGLGNNLAEGIGHKRISPEFQSGIALLWLAFESNAINDGSVDSVGNRVR